MKLNENFDQNNSQRDIACNRGVNRRRARASCVRRVPVFMGTNTNKVKPQTKSGAAVIIGIALIGGLLIAIAAIATATLTVKRKKPVVAEPASAPAPVAVPKPAAVSVPVPAAAVPAPAAEPVPAS